MRQVVLSIGLLLLAAIWLGPLLGAWRASFASGMVAHMGVVAVAAPLIAVGLPMRWQIGASMPMALPVVASLLELLAVWGWHAPAMRAAAEASLTVTVLEQASFLLVGLFLWATSFTQWGERKHALTGAGALLLTSIHMTLLGALLALSPRSLYGAGDVTCFGTVLNAGQDQQLGGVIMLLVGAIVYLAGGLVLIGRLLEEPRRRIGGSIGTQ